MKLQSKNFIIKQLLNDLLLSWQKNEINIIDVTWAADYLMDELDIEADEELRKDDYRSILFEIIYFLDMYNHVYITKKDIPTILEFLNTELGEELNEWYKWIRYWKKIDYEKRFNEATQEHYCKDKNCYILPINRYKFLSDKQHLCKL